MAPSICKLELEGCLDVVIRSTGSLISLTSLYESNVNKIPVELGQLHSLVELYVSLCPKLKEMPPILQNLTSLKVLHVVGCPILESLPEEMQNNTTLQRLFVRKCDSLRSLPRCINILGSLSIHSCNKLELSLDEDMTNKGFSSLTTLYMQDSCDSLKSFPLAFFTKF